MIYFPWHKSTEGREEKVKKESLEKVQEAIEWARGFEFDPHTLYTPHVPHISGEHTIDSTEGRFRLIRQHRSLHFLRTQPRAGRHATGEQGTFQ